MKLFRTIFIEVIAKCTYFNANQSSNLGAFISLRLSPNNPETLRYKSPVRFSNSRTYAWFRGFKFSGQSPTTLEFLTPPDGDQLTHSTYSSTDPVPESGMINGTLSNGAKATSEQETAYNTALGDLDNTDHSYEVYKLKVTVVENIYEYEKNNSPYVTTNPKFSVTGGQFLTGDGVSSYNYASTAFKSIIDDQKNESAKAYTICPTQLGLTENAEALSNLRKELSTSYAEFRSYINANGNQGMKNFPLFVAEDTTEATLTALINNYLQTLTNTNFNYADTSKTNIYEVGLYKCVFDQGNGEFVVDTGSSNLKRKAPGGEYYFYMEAKDVDTQDVPQFTLMDIKFKDPSDATKIVYHLYVPVYVKKVLRFDFNAHIKSGTDYYWSAYYTADESTAKLTYNVVESPITDPVGPFSSLGINSVETANPYSSFVDTIAVYDISKLKNPGEYVELTFSLSKRSNYNSALPIESYLDGVTIYGSDQDSDGTEDVIFLQTADSITTGDNRRTDKGTTEYKVRVKKNLLKTQPGGAFIIPIHFNVKTGDSLFNSQTGGLEYSNYRSSSTRSLRERITPSP